MRSKSVFVLFFGNHFRSKIDRGVLFCKPRFLNELFIRTKISNCYCLLRFIYYLRLIRYKFTITYYISNAHTYNSAFNFFWTCKTQPTNNKTQKAWMRWIVRINSNVVSQINVRIYHVWYYAFRIISLFYNVNNIIFYYNIFIFYYYLSKTICVQTYNRLLLLNCFDIYL